LYLCLRFPESGVVTIAETQSVYGPLVPQTPGYTGAYAAYRRNSGSSVSRRRPLTTTEKGLLIAFTTLVSAPIAILGRGGQVAFWAWKLRPIAIPLAFGVGMEPIVPTGLEFLSPGGGGPGHSPISTNTPPSLVEQGRAMAEAGKYGRTPSPSVGKESRASRGSRKKCPPGKIWSPRLKRCVTPYREFTSRKR
jgi:hypothetical protein